MILTKCQRLGQDESDPGSVNPDAIGIDGVDSVVCHDLACMIAQSVEYFTRTEAGLVEAPALGFSMSVARGCLALMKSRDVVWFNVIYRRLSVLDIRLQGFLDDMSDEQRLRLLRIP